MRAVGRFLKYNSHLIAYGLMVLMMASGFAYIQWDSRQDEKDSYAARIVVCRTINKTDMNGTLRLVNIAKTQRAQAIANGLTPPPTPQEQAAYDAGIKALIDQTKADALPCAKFATNPTEFIDDPRVVNSLGSQRLSMLHV